MILSKVTITGADNNTDIQELVNLSNEFPFVEWGILFSKKRLNTPRYPYKHYAFALKQLAQEQGVYINLSGHICGEWTKEFFNGNFSFREYFSPINYFEIFKRVQLNFNSSHNPYDIKKVMELIGNDFFTKFVFQYNNSNTKLCKEVTDEFKDGDVSNVNFLYDSSGGRGTARNSWPGVIKGHYTGYAGGLSPVNLKEQLELIGSVTSENDTIWIDTETGVRDQLDNLDLNKVREFLTIAKEYTKYK